MINQMRPLITVKIFKSTHNPIGGSQTVPVGFFVDWRIKCIH